MSYARNTTVPVERSKAEIERLLQAKGATSFHSGWNADFASLGFTISGTQVMIGVPMPQVSDYRRMSRTRGEAAYQAESRRRWRCLLLILKAKFEAIASGISTIEKEFLADVVLPNGRTLGEWAVPMIGSIQSGQLKLPEHAQ